MTEIGNYFARKSINRADISRKTGISKSRLNELANNNNTQLRVEELYLISLAIDEDPGVLIKYLCKNLTLPDK